MLKETYTYTLSDLLDNLTHKQAKELKNTLPTLFGVDRSTINRYMKNKVGHLSMTNIKILEAAIGRPLPFDIDAFNPVELVEE